MLFWIVFIGCIVFAYTLGLVFGYHLRQNNKVDTPSASERYNELLMAVCNKYPGESRHETALRYIRQAESNSYCGGAPNAQGKISPVDTEQYVNMIETAHKNTAKSTLRFGDNS